LPNDSFKKLKKLTFGNPNRAKSIGIGPFLIDFGPFPSRFHTIRKFAGSRKVASLEEAAN
jgi:hypothetical protein